MGTKESGRLPKVAGFVRLSELGKSSQIAGNFEKSMNLGDGGPLDLIKRDSKLLLCLFTVYLISEAWGAPEIKKYDL